MCVVSVRTGFFKVCGRCKKELPISCFCKNKSRKDGYHTDCRSCRKETYEKFKGGNPISVAYKLCPRCKIEKSSFDFIRDRGRFDGLSIECKVCRRLLLNSAKSKRWRIAHIKQAKQAVHAYYVKNRARINMKQGEFNKNHRALLNERRRLYYETNKEKVFERDRAYRIKRKDNLNAWRRFQYSSNPNYKLRANLHSCVSSSLRENKRFYRTEELLGCSLTEFKAYFESKFLEGMSWSLFLAGDVWIDHIIPCSMFNLLDPTEVKQCFHYTNLAPMWARDNMKKSNKVCTSFGVLPATRFVKLCGVV